MLMTELSAVDAALLADLDIELSDGRPAVAVAHHVPDMAAARAWLTDHRGAIRAAIQVFGSLLIRGLPVATTDDFATARDRLLDRHLAYQERSTPRTEYGDGVYSSTDMPARHSIRLHNESSYVLRFPGMLLFGCIVAPAENGATTVGDSREVLARLDPQLADRFRSRGWTLLRNYHPSLSLPWPEVFGTFDRAELESYFREALIGWQWREDGGLRTSQRRAAILRHPVTGEEIWFNHVAFWNRYTMDPAMREALISSYGEYGLPYETAYGDGQQIPEAEIAHLNGVYDQIRRREPYRAGDLLLLDNLLSCHGREAYQGDRKVLVAMGQLRSVSDCDPSISPAPGVLAEEPA
jgi:hypothetical protein